jgi:thiamine pyrophosphate-dependent acetolactate synthase large subunit-like protein
VPHPFQSIGLGLASAIGFAIANPGALTVLGAGDSGFLLSIADLDMAIRLNLRLCILVYNDSSYAAEVHLTAGTTSISCSSKTPFRCHRTRYGARGVTVMTLDDLEPVRPG